MDRETPSYRRTVARRQVGAADILRASRPRSCCLCAVTDISPNTGFRWPTTALYLYRPTILRRISVYQFVNHGGMGKILSSPPYSAQKIRAQRIREQRGARLRSFTYLYTGKCEVYSGCPAQVSTIRKNNRWFLVQNRHC